MNRQYGVAVTLNPALVDDLLRPSLHLRVTALHRVKVQVRRIGAGGHGTGGAAAHADAHAGATQLNQQASRRKRNLVCLARIDHPQSTRDHDGLVVATLYGVYVTGHRLLVLAEIAEQVGPAKLVVEGSTTQGAFNHDLQRTGNMLWLAELAPPQFRHGKPGQTRLGFGATSGGTFVTNFTAGPRRCARKRRDGSGMVMGFHLHQNMVGFATFFIAGYAYPTCVSGRFRYKPFNLCAVHHRRIVGVRHQHVLGILQVGVANHAKQGVLLHHAVNGELGVKDLVAAVLAVGLGKHHQLDIGRVAAQGSEGVDQVIHFVSRKRQSKRCIGRYQSSLAAADQVHMLHRLRPQCTKKVLRLRAVQHGALGHPVVQQGCNLFQLRGGQGRMRQQSAFEREAVLRQPLNTFDRQTTVVRNVGRFGCPGGYGAKTGADHHTCAI